MDGASSLYIMATTQKRKTLAPRVVTSVEQSLRPLLERNRSLSCRVFGLAAPLWEQMYEPRHPSIVVVKVTQDVAMWYNQDIAYSSGKSFAHAESRFSLSHIIYFEIIAHFPKYT